MHLNTILLGVNIDHIATLRQARKIRYPDPVFAVQLAEEAGADGITVHLREDRRHIQERDIYLLKDILLTRMNLEMAATDEMIAFARKVQPEHCCIVPEKRQELTTEGGLDVIGQKDKIKDACKQLSDAGILVSLFIDPEISQIEAAQACGASVVEIHTGKYADADSFQAQSTELEIIKKACEIAKSKGLIVNAGHGLNYQNVKAIAGIPEITELNIGHGIIARSVFTGIKEAVIEIKRLMYEGRGQDLNAKDITRKLA